MGRKWGEYLSKNQSKILEAIADNPSITIEGLSERIGIGATAVENNLKKLKEKGAIVRAGSARSGEWRINGKD
ncbi:MAG: winged helix-turn-helix domain-containing protein [Syntrophales bacterium]